MRPLALFQTFKLWTAAFRRAKHELVKEREEYKEKLEIARTRFGKCREIYINTRKVSDGIGNLCNIPGFPASAANTLATWTSGLVDKKDIDSAERKLDGFEGVAENEADMEFYKANIADLDIFIEELDEKLKSIGH